MNPRYLLVPIAALAATVAIAASSGGQTQRIYEFVNNMTEDDGM